MDLEELSKNITNEIKKMQDDKAISEMYKTQLAIKSAMTDERQKERELDILDEKNKIAKTKKFFLHHNAVINLLQFYGSLKTVLNLPIRKSENWLVLQTQQSIRLEMEATKIWQI